MSLWKAASHAISTHLSFLTIRDRVITVSKIPVGELIVDLGDVKNRKFVWRGKATSTISDKPEKVNKMLDKALAKMFQDYPPKPKK